MSGDYSAVFECREHVSIVPAVLDADNTEVTTDMLNFRSATVCTVVGVGGITFDATNKVEFKLTHSDDDSTYTAVTADDVIMPFGETLGAGGIIRSLIAAKAAADASAHQVGYVGKKRYLQLLADFSGTHAAGTPMAATIILGHPLHAPTDQGNYDDSHSQTF